MTVLTKQSGQSVFNHQDDRSKKIWAQQAQPTTLICVIEQAVTDSMEKAPRLDHRTDFAAGGASAVNISPSSIEREV